MPDLSIIIPSRNEMFLARTVQDLIQNIRGDTEIIVVLDGQWADPQIADHPKVTLIHHSESVGQRAATNEAARLSRAKYLIKCDAHCAFDEGFDVKMMEVIQPDWTMVPMMRNLHVFDWVCKKCGDRRYQGNTPTECPKCDNKTDFERDIVWIAKTNPQCSSYCFDPEPHFQYMRDFKKRPEGKGDITPTMSLQGSFFMCTREKYFELNLCDESFGSWGSQGIEIAAKVWLSGGQVMCNKKTWYAHLFRCKSGDFGFPYPQSGRAIQNAKKTARELFFTNSWPKQVYPLSWLVKKFWPLPGWSQNDLDQLSMTDLPRFNSRNDNISMGNMVSLPVGSIANGTSSRLSGDLGGENMPIRTTCFPGLDEPNSTPTGEHMISVGNESQVEGITTGGGLARVMENGNISPPSLVGERMNQPCEYQPMDENNIFHESNIPIPTPVSGTIPQPTNSNGVDVIDGDLRKYPVDDFSRQNKVFDEIFTGGHNSSSCDELGLGMGRCDEHRPVPNPIPPNKEKRKGIIYYSDNRINPDLAKKGQDSIQSSGLPIVSVSLKPLDFGTNIVLDAERGYLTMFRQMLTGIEAMETDILFFCEHDVIYTKEHFDFIPPEKDKFYYNKNSWMIRQKDGFAVYWDCKKVSQICVYRDLALKHYKERVRRVEAEGFTRRMGFEPGTHGRAERVDDCTSEWFETTIPNLDIRHRYNLTGSRWSPSEFTSLRRCRNWKESHLSKLPGWEGFKP